MITLWGLFEIVYSGNSMAKRLDFQRSVQWIKTFKTIYLWGLFEHSSKYSGDSVVIYDSILIYFRVWLEIVANSISNRVVSRYNCFKSALAVWRYATPRLFASRVIFFARILRNLSCLFSEPQLRISLNSKSSTNHSSRVADFCVTGDRTVAVTSQPCWKPSRLTCEKVDFTSERLRDT